MNQMYTPPLSRINKFIIIFHVGLFLLNAILGQTMGINLVNLLGLSLDGIKSGFIFQIVTFPFIEVSFMGVLFNSLILWFIGSELEQRWSEVFYLKFLMLSAIGAGLFYLGLSLVFGGTFSVIPLHGINGMTFALLVAYGIIFSERQLTFMLLFPMKAKYFCMLLIGIELYMGIFSTYGKASWAHLFSMGIGFLYLQYRSQLARGKGMKDMLRDLNKEKKKSKFSVLSGGKDDDPNNKPPKYWQ
jgi:membrane associated rhomboid family serine protease